MKLTEKQSIRILSQMFKPYELLKNFNDTNVKNIAKRNLYLRKGNTDKYYVIYEDLTPVASIDVEHYPSRKRYIEEIMKK